jgi:hypothetical protein
VARTWRPGKERSGRRGHCYDFAVTQAAGSLPIAVGDVWDALEGAGFQVTTLATGRRLLTGPQQQLILLHGRELVGYRPAADDLLAQLGSWGVHPVASGKYHPPPGANASSMSPYSALPLQAQPA